MLKKDKIRFFEVKFVLWVFYILENHWKTKFYSTFLCLIISICSKCIFYIIKHF